MKLFDLTGLDRLCDWVGGMVGWPSLMFCLEKVGCNLDFRVLFSFNFGPFCCLE